MKRLAWFSPLPISPDGATSTGAYWTNELLPKFKQEFEVEIFYNGFGRYEDFSTFHFLSAAKRHAERPFDLILYHFEDKRCSDFVRMHLGLIPGVVLFHDLLLTTDGPEPILNSSWGETVQRFSNSGGAWPDRKNEYKRERPLAVREIGLAPVAIFSCPRLHSEYKREVAGRPHIGSAHSYYLPHPVTPSNSGLWGSPSGGKVALCGGPEIEFRAHKIFQALSKIERAEFLWLVSKEEEHAAVDLAAEFAMLPGEIRVGRSPEAWSEVVADSDVAVHALFSVYGQLGPFLQISQMAGLPCVTLDFGSSEFISERIVFKVEPGENEVPELESLFDRLLTDRTSDWGAAGRTAALEEFSSEKVAAELIEILHREEPELKKILARWSDLEREAKSIALVDSTPKRDPLTSALDDSERKVFVDLGWTE